jgi:hypothetical protein
MKLAPSIKRLALAGSLLCSTLAFAAQPVSYSASDWYRGWAVNAVKQQNHIDQNSPLKLAVFPTTHNSFNSKVYANLNGRYLDPNHVLSIYDQLRSGIRAIEMDVHWTSHLTGTWPWEWRYSNELLLCHGQSNNLGCHTNDRVFTEGLDELARFLNENPNEVVLLYVEEYLQGHYNEAVNMVQSRLGNRIYTSTAHYGGNGCGELPRELTKAQVRAAGKNLLIMGADSCGNPWSAITFKGHFHNTVDHNKLSAYPNCQIDGMGPANWQGGLTRAYNDSTILSGQNKMSLAQVETMVRCGFGAVAPEPLAANDERHSAQVWSWAVNEPNNATGSDAEGENCAEHASNGRFNDNSCKVVHRYACQNQSSRAWRITNAAGQWQDGRAACQAEFGNDGYAFATPSNGYENAKLVDAKNAAGAGAQALWLNYADLEQEGYWTAYRPVYAQWPAGEEGRTGCASLRSYGQYQNQSCDQVKPVACQQRVTGEWKISSRTGNFTQAEAICSAEFGVQFGFAVPANKAMFDALMGTRADNVWLNLRNLGSSNRMPNIMLPREAAVIGIVN